MAEADGFVIVTPGHNHSYPASLKRAIDWHYPEWQFRAATVISSGVQGGLLATEHLRGVFAELSVVTERRVVGLRAPWATWSIAGTYRSRECPRRWRRSPTPTKEPHHEPSCA